MLKINQCNRIIFLLLFPLYSLAQQSFPDSIRKALQAAPDDSTRFQLGRLIYTYFEETNRDSALHYAEMRYAIARKHHRKIEEAFTRDKWATSNLPWRFSEGLTSPDKRYRCSDRRLNRHHWDRPSLKPGKNRMLTLSMRIKCRTPDDAEGTTAARLVREGREWLEIGNDFRVLLPIWYEALCEANNMDPHFSMPWKERITVHRGLRNTLLYMVCTGIFI